MSAAAALALVLTAGQAAAPAPLDLIETMNVVCVAARGEPARAAVLAREAGFSPTPAGILPSPRNSSDVIGFVRSNETDVSFVMTGKMTRRIGRETVVMDFCGVTARPTDHRAIQTRLREVMAFAPVRGGGFQAYAWLQTPEGRAPARDLPDAQFISMTRTGQMRMLAVDRTGPGSTLFHILPKLD